MITKSVPARCFSITAAGLAVALLSFACGGIVPLSSEAPPEAAAPEPAFTEPAIQPIVPPTVVPTAAGPLIGPELQPSPQPVINEARRLTLEFPPQIRVGEGEIIRLTLEVDTLGNLTPTAEFDGNVVTGEILEVPDLYETHHVTAEARLDLAGIDVRPGDLISEPLLPGQSVTFYWSVRPREVGLYRGTAWLYLRFVDKASGSESRKTLSAQLVEIEAVNLLGFPLGLVRGAGMLGSVIGGVLGFPFLEDILKLVFRRRRR